MPDDTGTPELHKRKTLKKVQGPIAGTTKTVVLDSTHIDKLLLDEKIFPDEHAALDRYAEDIFRGGLIGLRSPSMEPRSSKGGGDISAKEAFRRAMVNKAVKYMDAVSPEGRRYVYDLCLSDTPVPDAGLGEFRKAVKALKGYYDAEDF